MVDYQIKPNVCQMHLLHLVVEFWPLEDLKGISKDVEDLVRLDFGMATLHQGLISNILFWLIAIFLGIKSFNFLIPLSLDDFNHIRFNFRRVYQRRHHRCARRCWLLCCWEVLRLIHWVLLQVDTRRSRSVFQINQTALFIVSLSISSKPNKANLASPIESPIRLSLSSAYHREWFIAFGTKFIGVLWSCPFKIFYKGWLGRCNWHWKFLKIQILNRGEFFFNQSLKLRLFLDWVIFKSQVRQWGKNIWLYLIQAWNVVVRQVQLLQTIESADIRDLVDLVFP